MIQTDVNSKPISLDFDEAIDRKYQVVKPKVIIDFLDSRHLSNAVVTTSEDAVLDSTGLSTFFSKGQLINGYPREITKWAVSDALDYRGKPIVSDGTYLAMPSDSAGDSEFGWWSKAVSTDTLSDGGYLFAEPVVVDIEFDARPINKIVLNSAENYGRLHKYEIQAFSDAPGAANPVYSEVAKIDDDFYYYTHVIPEVTGWEDINHIRVSIISTKNKFDKARINEINTIYEVDISNYVISVGADRVRDLHETTLPIAGSGSSSLNITINNTDKDFNPFSSQSTYGQYMDKELRVKLHYGVKINDADNDTFTTQLLNPVSTSDSTISVLDTSGLPVGGSNRNFIITIDKGTISEEVILCNSVTSDTQISVQSRSYDGRINKAHLKDAPVEFDNFEYVQIGEFYIEDWNSSAGSMTVTTRATDWSKYLNEKTITTGFFIEESTVAEAINNLLAICNYPTGDYKYLNNYARDVNRYKSVINLNFNEKTQFFDTLNSSVVSNKNGLRARFWGFPTNLRKDVINIKADALEVKLSDLQKALGEKPYVDPDLVTLSSNISSNGAAINISNYSFTATNNTAYSDYYNGVFDGYYIPVESGERTLRLNVKNGGVRMFLDDNVIIEYWKNAGNNTASIVSDVLDLDAGTPYKVRIEFYHIASDFNLSLIKVVGNAATTISASEFCITPAFDSTGSIDDSLEANNKNLNHLFNNALYIKKIRDTSELPYATYENAGNLSNDGGIVSQPDSKSYRVGGSNYCRLPYHSSLNLVSSTSSNYTGEWSIEAFLKIPFATPYFSGNGDYISSFATSPAAGFEFFATSSSNGFKIVTSSGIQTISTNSALPANEWFHLSVTYLDGVVSYYVNGQLKASAAVASPVTWENTNICFGGRGCSFVNGYEIPPGAVGQEDVRQFFIDHFGMYNRAMTADDVRNRYTESQIQEQTVYPFLFGNDNSVKGIIDEITLADLGRLYFDEYNMARYEHMNRLFEPSIDQHANVQLEIDDEDYIIDADFVTELLMNKITVKVSGVTSSQVGTQGLWRAPDPTTLGVVALSANVSATANSISVTSTINPPFTQAGYLKIDSEIIKYSSKDNTAFTSIERGVFGTTAAEHSAGARVREVRYFDIKYDKAPAFNVKDPFIVGIRFEEPDQIELVKFTKGPYGGELILAASNNVTPGSIVFAEGTNPLTELVYYTAIAGIPVITTEQGSQIKEQTSQVIESIRKYGLKEMIIENRFINDFNHAQKLADFLIEKSKGKIPILNLTIAANPKLQVGDRIRIAELDAFDIINGDFWIISINTNAGDAATQTLTLRKVV